MTTNILLVDDHPVFRAGLRMLLEEQSDMLVVGEAGDGQAAIELAQSLSPDVVVMDISMPEMDGHDAKVMALSIHGEKHFVESMLGAGARGYLLKESAPEELVEGVRAIQGQQIYLSPAIRDIVLEQYMTSLADDVPDETMPATGEALLITKLHRPKIAQHTVPRPRLLAQFSGWRQRPLTLISAPAGYGKSTVVCQWLEMCDCPSAWLALDEADNDLHTFLTYLVAAIHTRFPDALQQLARLIKAPTLPAVNVVANTLTNELDGCPQRLVLVLEDYHHIVDPDIHELWRMVLRHPPHKLHIVLVTRVDPALDLLRLRAYHQMGEVRARDLGFVHEETLAFLEALLGESVKEGIARELTAKTEGWVTGLRLITLSIHAGDDLVGASNTLPGEMQTLHYLIAEALSRQPRNIQIWLLKTSILDRFCAPLCEAICASPGEEASRRSAAFIEWLMTANLFTIPLDYVDEWFRYHHLFQELLQAELEQSLQDAEIAELHMRACHWFEGRDLIDEALQHALAAGNVPCAVQLVVERYMELMNQDQWNLLDRWLQMLPLDTVETHPILLIAKAWHADHVGHLPLAWSLIDMLESLYADPQSDSSDLRQVEGEMYTLRAYRAYIALRAEDAVNYTQKALDLLPLEAAYARWMALFFQAVAYQMIGEQERTLEVVKNGVQYFANRRVGFGARTRNALLATCIITGDLATLKRVGQENLLEVIKQNAGEWIGYAGFYLGHAHYFRNELDDARRVLQYSLDNRYLVRPRYFAYAAFTVTRILIAEGRQERALTMVESVRTFAEAGGNATVEYLVSAFLADLALHEGDIVKAERYVEGLNHEFLAPFWLTFLPELTLAKLRIAQRQEQSLLTAKQELDRYLALGKSTYNTNYQIQVLALQSLLYDAMDDSAKAEGKLHDSLALARPGGYIRVYVDMGTDMAALLTRMADRSDVGEYILRILNAFIPCAESAADAFSSDQIDPLTPREMQVLRLLATEMSTEEIAGELVVSVATLRTHSKNIYGKLNAHSRHEAVSRAREFDLL